MNYCYKQVIILVKKHLTVDFRKDCNEGINKWVLIFCFEVNIAAVGRGSGESMWVCAWDTNVGLCLGHQCGFVPGAPGCRDPALARYYI